MSEIYQKTPKRKSILWDYQNDGNARIVALSQEKTDELDRAFEDEIPDLKVQKDDGVAILLNPSGTLIWEQCDGLTEVQDIVGLFVKNYRLTPEQALSDISEFLDFCVCNNCRDTIDMLQK